MVSSAEDHFEILAENSSEEIQQIRAQLARTMERLEMQQQREKVRFAQTAKAHSRALATPIERSPTPFSAISDSAMNSHPVKVLARAPFKLCESVNCLRLRDVKNGNNTFKYCSRHNSLNPTKKKSVAVVDIQIQDTPVHVEEEHHNDSDKRTSIPTSKKRTYDDTLTEVAGKKAEVINRRQMKATTKDSSLAVCDEIDDLADTVQKTARTLPWLQTRSKAGRKPILKAAKAVIPKARRSGRKKVVAPVEEEEEDEAENDDNFDLSDAGDNEHLVE